MERMSRRLIAPRPDTPVSSGSEIASGRLPEGLLAEQVQRLAVFSIVAGPVLTVGLLIDLFVLPLDVEGARNWRSVTLEAVASLASVAMYVFARRRRGWPRLRA